MNSNRIIEAIELVRDPYLRVNMADDKVFIAYLVMMYQIIVASEDLLEVGIEVSGDIALRAYFTEHLSEEKGHARMLGQDLAKHGVDVSGVPPYRLAVELAGSQYYYILQQSPYALLGYLAVMEGFPMPVQDVEELASIHGESLTRTLMLHAKVDIIHREELFKVIDSVDDELCCVIAANASRTQHLLNDVARFLNDSR